MRTTRIAATLVIGTVMAVILAACGAGSSGSSDAEPGSNKSVTIAVVPGWDEDLVVSHLWKYVLDEKGYDVSFQELDAAPMYIGLAKGDVDLYMDMWLPQTHGDYWKQYGDDIVDVGAWYDQATLNIAVPDYVDVTSIADLKGKAAEFDGKIVGIEPGAGLTRVTEQAIKDYGLDGFTLETSSTPAMLTELKRATEAKKPIVVTLWHPHWAYSAFPIKDLTDPKGAMGKPDKAHIGASQDFAKSNPEVIEAMKTFKMSDKELADLEKVALQDHPDDVEAGTKAWAEQNKEFVDGMMN
ncbi:MAG: glycine betaine ABC transporter substrate-binding protein [Microlunatus sp.]|nr:glycine betaine ABC transporter substrate-binding protein [Microlunatus sp.]MDN5770242.1 glycine betaine ABC transporter substrate-binding protein [Microlunatus sp.]